MVFTVTLHEAHTRDAGLVQDSSPTLEEQGGDPETHQLDCAKV